MDVVRNLNGKLEHIATSEASASQLKSLGSALAMRIIRTLSSGENYPLAIAKKLKVNEQKVYYHIRKLEQASIIKKVREETRNGIVINIYALSKPSFFVRFKDFRESFRLPDMKESYAALLEPFIENGKFNALIVVSSPEPHGPKKVRGRDGYLAIDLALFLGMFLNETPKITVKMDVDMRSEDLTKNLIIVGGPRVNRITNQLNDSLPIYFDEEKNWALRSKKSKKTYHADECGMIAKIRNPLNKNASILVIGGKRFKGTKAAVIALIKYTEEVSASRSGKIARVVEGYDADSDGIMDSVEFRE
ncbi:MAG: S-layer protein [Candidatus Woesearchaeota archaeon]